MSNKLLMCKKLLLSLTVLLLSPLTEVKCIEFAQPINSSCFCSSLFEFKAGYFFFTNSKLRKIYNGGIDLQLSASYPIKKWNQNWILNGYGSLEYFYLSGHSINLHQKTTLWSIPINIGLKPVYKINSIMDLYFAFGPRYSYIHQHNHSDYVDKNISKNAFGFFINTGLNYLLCNHIVIDIFGEYSYAKINIHSKKSRAYGRNIQIGGLTFGAGIGSNF